MSEKNSKQQNQFQPKPQQQGLSATAENSALGNQPSQASDASPARGNNLVSPEEHRKQIEEDQSYTEYPTIPNNNGEPIPGAPRRIAAEKIDPVKQNTEGGVKVLQWNVGEANGGMYIIPNTEREQIYTEEALKQLEDQNFFAESKMGYKRI